MIHGPINLRFKNVNLFMDRRWQISYTRKDDRKNQNHGEIRSMSKGCNVYCYSILNPLSTPLLPKSLNSNISCVVWVKLDIFVSDSPVIDIWHSNICENNGSPAELVETNWNVVYK